MSRRRPQRRRTTKRATPRQRAASAEAWAHVATKVFVTVFDALFGPPRPLRYGGFPALEPEPQPAAFRVVEPKALPAPQEA